MTTIAQALFLLIFVGGGIIVSILVRPQHELFTNLEGNISIKKSIIAIICYFVIMLILPYILTPICTTIYVIKNNIDVNVLNEGSEFFNEEAYNTFVATVNPILEIIIYSILTIVIVGILFKELINDFKAFKPMMLVWAVVGILLVYASSILGNVIETLLGATSTASNQQAIEDMFNAGGAGVVITIITTIFMAPLIEELIFRKALFSFFKNNLTAMIISALIFGFIHIMSPSFTALIRYFVGTGTINEFVLEMFYIVSYALMGLSLGATYTIGRKNILVSVLTHMAINTIAVLTLVFA